MPFQIPNTADAAFPAQAQPFATDIAILQAGIRGDGVVTGCAVTAQGSPDMTLAVAAGTIRISAVDAAVTSGNVTITAANATNPRIDLVVVNSSGTKSVTAGTAAAAPVAPAIPATSVVLAMVYVPANDTAINTNQITDKRVDLSTLNALLGTSADLFGYSAANKGSLMAVTDGVGGSKLYRSTGSAWNAVAAAGDMGNNAVRTVFPSNAKFETIGRTEVTTATLAAGTTGQLRMVALWLPINQVITSINVLIGGTALASGTHSWAALFDGPRNLLRQSTDVTSPVAAANTVVTFTLSSTYTTTASGTYYLGVMWTASTMPTLAGANNTAVANSLVSIYAGTSTGSLTDTAPNPAAAITGTAGVPYIYVI